MEIIQRYQLIKIIVELVVEELADEEVDMVQMHYLLLEQVE